MSSNWLAPIFSSECEAEGEESEGTEEEEEAGEEGIFSRNSAHER